MSIKTVLRAAIQGCAGKEDVLMELVRDERYYVLPWDAYDFWTWLYWKWERKSGMGSPDLNRLEKGFRLFGFTHIREWLRKGKVGKAVSKSILNKEGANA